MGFTKDFFTSRRNYDDGDSRVERPGTLWYYSEDHTLRVGDGSTPGGIILNTGGGEGGGNFILPTASTTIKGGVKIDGTTIKINNQIISGFSGDYLDLINRPTLFSGNYNDLLNRPVLFSGSFIDLTNKPTLFSGSYTDLTNLPSFSTVATTGSFTDLINRPSLKVSRIGPTGAITEETDNVTALRFDTESAFDVIDLGNGQVKIQMNSTFKYWKVDGQEDLIATGLDAIRLEAGQGITITTFPYATPYQTLRIQGFSGNYNDLTNKPDLSGTLEIYDEGSTVFSNISALNFKGTGVTITSSAVNSVDVNINTDFIGFNIDGGLPDTIYGGINPIDAGHI
jgi:hypothetical protein